jgi:hypothetical protein
MAGRRETNDLKPIDTIDIRTIASHRAAAQANAQVAPKTFNPGGRAHYRRAKAAWRVVDWQTRYFHSGGVVAAARRQERAKQLEKPSSSRRESGGVV